MAIAIFDFDGTIISRDSLPDFLIQACGRKAFLLRLPWIILLKGAALTGILSTHRAKELVISSFLRGMKTGISNRLVSNMPPVYRLSSILRPWKKYAGIRKKETRLPLSARPCPTGYAPGHKLSEFGSWKEQGWKLGSRL